MIFGMTGAIQGTQSCALCLEQLAVIDILLLGSGLVLVNARTWTKFKKTPDPSSMIEMIMGDDSMGDGGILRGKNSRECSKP